MNFLNNRICIKLFAGLGNQLFQYTYGQYLKSQSCKVSYILNKSFDNYGNCIDFPCIFNLSLKEKKEIYMPTGLLRNFRLLFRKAIVKYFFHCYSTGFYQKAKYIEAVYLNKKTDYKNSLIHSDLLYTFINEATYKKSAVYKKIISSNNETVFIHVRGGDYHNENQYTGICTADYYKEAITKILSCLTNPVFFIFTNDIKYAKEIINTNDGFFFVDDLQDMPLKNRDPGLDLFLMSCCKHAIIANSTYSWWGAFLQNKTDKHIVICPSQWDKTNPSQIDEIIPEGWVKT